jgi:hypothetical protein
MSGRPARLEIVKAVRPGIETATTRLKVAYITVILLYFQSVLPR